MASSKLHASRGIISGKVSSTTALRITAVTRGVFQVDLGGLRLSLAGRRRPDRAPSHSLEAKLGRAEVQVDWMSGQILIATATHASCRIADDWRAEADQLGNIPISRVSPLPFVLSAY